MQRVLRDIRRKLSRFLQKMVLALGQIDSSELYAMLDTASHMLGFLGREQLIVAGFLGACTMLLFKAVKCRLFEHPM